MIEIRHDHMTDTSHTKDAYNSIYQLHGILLSDSFYLWLINLLKPDSNKILLDISCGQGRLVTLAQHRGLIAIGMDFSESAIRIGSANCPDASWTVCDGEKLPMPDASVDYITHIGSLEHYIDPAAGMAEIARVLKPSGVACILLPNSFGLFGNIKHVWKTGEVFDDGQPLQRYNTLSGWKNMLVKKGLVPFSIKKYEREWPLTWRDLRWYLIRPLKVARLFSSWFIPLNLSNCFVYLCRRTES
jgi:SAM-dependent methyltransferase